jgi:hypothetical protein
MDRHKIICRKGHERSLKAAKDFMGFHGSSYVIKWITMKHICKKGQEGYQGPLKALNVG